MLCTLRGIDASLTARLLLLQSGADRSVPGADGPREIPAAHGEASRAAAAAPATMTALYLQPGLSKVKELGL